MSWISDSTVLRRDGAAVALVVAAGMSIAWVATQPEFPDGYEARLAAVQQGGAAAAASAGLFVASQLPMLVGLLGVAHLVRRGAPALANVGLIVVGLGCFGHAVYGGISMMTVVMAQDPAHRTEYAALLADVESSPVMVFTAMGLLGTVLGLLLLAVGLWRTRVVPRWIPALLGLFLVVEFVGAGMSAWASYLSGALLLVAFVALARAVRSDWESAAEPALAATARPALGAQPMLG